MVLPNGQPDSKERTPDEKDEWKNLQNHNAMLSEVSLLNRLAEENGLPLFYDGEVSAERPIRTWVADAVLAYVRQVIEDRITGGR